MTQRVVGSPIKAIAVAGGGSAGLLAAITLKTRIPELHVTVLRSPEISASRVGEGSTPYLVNHLHGYLNVSPDWFYRTAHPAWKLGIRFFWGDRPFDYTFSRQLDWKWNDLRRSNGHYCELDFSDASQASALMSAAKPFPRQQNGDPLIERSFGYHLENQRLTASLETLALQRGVELRSETVGEVEVAGDQVTALHLSSGDTLSADLYIDASGFRSLLLGRALQGRYLEFGSSLLCDRAITTSLPRTNQRVLPYTIATAMNAGWGWQIDHPDRINYGYVYSSKFLSDAEAEDEFRTKVGQAADIRLLRFPSGRYEQSWMGNVVGIGNAAGFVEPLEATSLHVICFATRLLTESFLASDGCLTPTLRHSFNRRVARMWDQIRWFLAVHYRFNSALDTPFWQACRRDIDIGPAQDFVEFYRENGPISIDDDTLLHPSDLFGIEGYLTMLLGMKVPHRRQIPIETADQKAWERIRSGFRSIAHHAMSFHEVHAAITSEDWKWYPGYFNDDDTPYFNLP